MFEPFTVLARAKINLALHVLGRRLDGYHDLDSIVAFADMGDVLRFSPADCFSLSADGPFAADLPPPEHNIITRAWAKTKDLAGGLPPVAVHLTKNLPVASGIGGGSANAAAALRGFLRIAEMDCRGDDVMAVALALGADVPVCLQGRACRMRGLGERITPLDDFAPVRAVLVNPGLAVATVEVFSRLGLVPGEAFGTGLDGQTGPAAWRNDLTASAVAMVPAIAEVLDWLKSQPGIGHVAMSGSGATCFGLNQGPFSADAVPRGWWLRTVRLS
jgi:4-diphosphocytidyl-2-C-methyl-D-erythritol kinase